ncbi:hypothetical protein SK571_27300 [Lentzea sp. BCCO 10_0798]|uniref:DUF596 domain-containing protein n=1 Tax=Lentzea kristufekii TaxID=3095430 RepID=A0ABU4TZA5_9PSEU|nr:hypothetical protein [Lentzea sp. BCCO 10_0798]MDX8053101.1 hypothetical protein [Lentzea sp. BCCO 10_0798]
MSKTTTFSVDDQGFWMLDDAFEVWLCYLIDAAERVAPVSWAAELAEDWKSLRHCPDMGDFYRDLTGEQRRLLLEICTDARQHALEGGDVPRDFTRTGKDHVEAVRVLEVADGCLELLNGTFPADPPGGAWFLGYGEGWAVMPVSAGALNKPRFAL